MMPAKMWRPLNTPTVTFSFGFVDDTDTRQQRLFWQIFLNSPELLGTSEIVKLSKNISKVVRFSIHGVTSTCSKTNLFQSTVYLENFHESILRGIFYTF